MIFSFEKPRSKKTGRVKRIMIGGPQITTTAFSALGATSLQMVGTTPSLPFQFASPLSTVTCSSISSRVLQASSSSLKMSSDGSRAAQAVRGAVAQYGFALQPSMFHLLESWGCCVGSWGSRTEHQSLSFVFDVGFVLDFLLG